MNVARKMTIAGLGGMIRHPFWSVTPPGITSSETNQPA